MLLVFDGDCSFCSTSARLFRRITKNKVPATAYQLYDLESVGLAAEQCSEALQYVTKDAIYSGHEAVARSLIDSKTAWSLLGYFLRVPVVSSVGYLVYTWVAKNRNRLPGGTPECAVNR